MIVLGYLQRLVSCSHISLQYYTPVCLDVARGLFLTVLYINCRMNYDQVRELLSKFGAMSNLNDNGGQVDIDTFAKHMGLPVNDTLQELFNLFDRVRNSSLS